ncbi:MAG: sulfatase-like hydrolase/transferase [Clostridia bacterium]
MKKPNILFLFPDELRREWLSYSDDIFKYWEVERPNLNLPNIEYLQKRGVTFLNAVTPSPLCAPARACLAAGVQYKNCETFNNTFDFPIDKSTVYKAMQDEGYEVCGVGKFDLQKLTCDWFDESKPKSWGFSKAIDNEGKMDCVKFAKRLGKAAGPYMKFLDEHGYMETHIDDMHDRKHKTNTCPLPDNAYCDNWITQNAIDFISEIPLGKPWFMQVNFAGPHPPFDITEQMRETVENRHYETGICCTLEYNLETRKNYAAMIENIDRNIGLLIELLKERGELDNTVIVFSSDHGEMLGDFNRYGKGVAFRGSINIPLVVSMSNGVRQNEYENSFVELQDLTQTFADITGAKFERKDESISLLDLLNDKTKTHRDFAISSLINSDNGFKCIVDNNYKYVETKKGEKSLFNLQNDILEKNNIIDKNEVVAKNYENKLNMLLDFNDIIF